MTDTNSLKPLVKWSGGKSDELLKILRFNAKIFSPDH